MPLTGPDSAGGIEDRDAAIAGIGLWQAAHGDRIRGHEIVVRAEDDGCTDSAIARQAAERLVVIGGLAGVLGPDCSAGAQAAAPIFAAHAVVQISGAATETELTFQQPAGRFFFRTVYSNELQGALIGQFVADGLHPASAWVVDDGEVYGQDLAAAAQAALERGSVSVRRRSIQRGTVDFSALAREIAAAKPGFVGFGGFNPEAALFYRQLRDAGYTGPFGAGDAAASIPNFVLPLGADLAEGVYFAGCPVALPGALDAEFRRVHGGAPVASPFVPQYADAARVLLDAIDRTAEEQPDGSLRIDRDKLRDAVRVTAVNDGFSGQVAFDANGDRTSLQGELQERARDLAWTACQVRGGRFVQIFP